MYEMVMTFTFMVWVYVLILFALLAASCAVIYIIYFIWDYISWRFRYVPSS